MLDIYYYIGIFVAGGDMNGDGQSDLLLYIPHGGNGGMGGGYMSVFAIKDGVISKLQLPGYLDAGYSPEWYSLEIELRGEHDLRITSKNPDFVLDASFDGNYAREIPSGWENESNCADPVYAYTISDGCLELRQYVWLYAHYIGVGDLVTTLRWDESGTPIVDARFEAY
jgi:hypothetical protein